MSNVPSCSTWQLYVILDRAAIGDRDLLEVARQVIRGGADAIQLREKTASAHQLIDDASRLLRVTRPAHIPLLINDRVDVAVAAGADGVHVGQDDTPVSVVRSLLGPDRIIGQSTHRLEQAINAEREGADYIALGPIFPTPTKPDYVSVGLDLIRQVNARVRKPVVCIGGIDQETLPSVLRAGARCVAVVRAVCSAKDPCTAAQALKRLLQRTSSPSRASRNP